MSGDSRSPSIEPNHSEDQSFGSFESIDIVGRSSSSSPKLSDPVGSHDSYTPRGQKIVDSPRSESIGPSARVEENAETDPLVNEPSLPHCDGTNDAIEPKIDDEAIIHLKEMALLHAEAELLNDQQTRAGPALHYVYNHEEIKAEQMLIDEEIEAQLHRIQMTSKPGSSRQRATKKRALTIRTTRRRTPES